MHIIVRIANVFAFLSCPMWNPFGPIRHVSRGIYRWLAENRFLYGLAMRKHGVRIYQTSNHVRLRPDIDTYPRVYADKRFAPWEEVADPDNPKRYNLISSRGGQVIRRSTGYCAQKILEVTGAYPQRISQKRFDASDWVEFLSEAGYQTIADRPRPGHHYVGVIPGEGEFGQVVWFEMLGREISPVDSDIDAAVLFTDAWRGTYVIPYDDAEPGCSEFDMDFLCTTYKEFVFRIVCIDHTRHDVIWVRID